MDQFDEPSKRDYDYDEDYCIYIPFTKTLKTEEKYRRFLFGKQKLKLALFEFGWSYTYNDPHKTNFNLSIYLQHPIFLRACSEKLEELNDYFKPQINSYNIKQDFIVNDNW